MLMIVARSFDVSIVMFIMAMKFYPIQFSSS